MSGVKTTERIGNGGATLDAPPSPRAEALAQRLEQGARALARLAASISEREWTTRVPHDGRTVGVIVHHVASVYPLEVQLARTIGDGTPITGVTMDDVHLLNARHAADHANVSQADAVALLESNAADAARAIRALDDEALDRSARASLYDDAPVSCRFVLEDHAVRHSYHHLAVIARALGRRVTLAVALAMALVLGGSAGAQAGPIGTLADAVRAATWPLRNPEDAIAAGWAPATGCVSGPQSGAMGTHYINGSLLFDGQLDADRPESLIFETRNGRSVLVGAEFLVIADQWHAANGPQPPVLRGQHFHLVSGANRYGLPAFYELHVWAWKHNPNGTYADWHAHVTCDDVTGS
ncbi:MAG: DinB family protein [Vicinamibacterales bacterium]